MDIVPLLHKVFTLHTPDRTYHVRGTQFEAMKLLAKYKSSFQMTISMKQ